MNRPARLIALLLACALPLCARAAVVEEVFELPVEVRDIYARPHKLPITVTVFRDTGRAKSPFLVLNHGRAGTALGRSQLGRARYTDNARYFVSKGFAVFVPTRVGYGATGGADVESSGDCARRDFRPTFEAGADQVVAVIQYAKAQPYVDPERGLVAGQSFGGAISIALSARGVRGVAGAINFAGGGGGNPEDRPENPCSEDALRRVLAAYGGGVKIPTLWIYSENDRYWGREKPRAWFEAFRANGGPGEFVQLPPHGADGHGSFTRNPDAWRPAVEKFLAQLGF